MEEEGEIIVVGSRLPPPARDSIGGGGGGGGGGGRASGGGGQGSRERPQPPEQQKPTPPEHRPDPLNNKLQASPGQENFAEDGNPFNDGEAPTNATVLAWLNALFANSTNPGDGFVFIQDNTDPPTTYWGTYTLNGVTTRFSSDGYGHYGQTELQGGRPSSQLESRFDLYDDFLF